MIGDDAACMRTSSLHAERTSLPAETFRLSLGNSLTLQAGVMDLGSAEQAGRFLQWETVAELLLSDRLRASSDLCSAHNRSRADELPVPVLALALIIVL